MNILGNGDAMRPKAILVAWLALAPVVALAAGELPAGWIKAGSRPNDYEMGVDTSTRHGGRASAFVKFIGKRGARVRHAHADVVAW